MYGGEEVKWLEGRKCGVCVEPKEDAVRRCNLSELGCFNHCFSRRNRRAAAERAVSDEEQGLGGHRGKAKGTRGGEKPRGSRGLFISEARL